MTTPDQTEPSVFNLESEPTPSIVLVDADWDTGTNWHDTYQFMLDKPGYTILAVDGSAQLEDMLKKEFGYRLAGIILPSRDIKSVPQWVLDYLQNNNIPTAIVTGLWKKMIDELRPLPWAQVIEKDDCYDALKLFANQCQEFAEKLAQTNGGHST